VTDHDRLFKELLSTFFLEFLELFAPELAREVAPGSLRFERQEVFTDITEGKHHVLDLLAQVSLRSTPMHVLVHVEPQATARAGFARRMHRYFENLDLRHALPVYPIALFSYERPRVRQPACYDLRLAGLHVVRFRFRAVQLNRLDWRKFAKRPNPVAAALMARMRIAPRDRVKVKLVCLRLLVSLALDPARTRQVSVFVDSYLRLSEDERRLFDKELVRVAPEERGKVMELTTSWKEEGIEVGLARGRQEATLGMVLRLLGKRLGALPEQARARVVALPLADLETLGEDLLDFHVLADLDSWLSRGA
jgi:hypothetical protein